MNDIEIDLWKSYREGDETARIELILFYLPLVDVLAKNIARISGANWEDLRQEGIIGLISAMARFDPGQGIPFRAFARNYIRGAIFDSSELTRDMARRQEEIYRKARRIEADLTQTLQRPPTIEEIAEKANFTVEQMINAIDARAVAFSEETPTLQRLPTIGEIVTVEQIINAIDVRELVFSEETPTSIRLVLQGSRDGFERLKELFKSGELSNKLGVTVKEIQWEAPQRQTRSTQNQDLTLKLSTREQLVIYEFYWSGRSDEEIAEKYGLTVKIVAMTRRRAIEKVRNRLEYPRAT